MPNNRNAATTAGQRKVAPGGGPPAFTEAGAWRAVGAGWRPLFGNFRKLGFSFEWHDFRCAGELDWSRSFHPGSIELCLNLAGAGTLDDGERRVELGPRMLAFYHQGKPPLAASRSAYDAHQFITVEFSPEFLQAHLQSEQDNLHPLVRAVVRGETKRSQVTKADRLNTAMSQLVDSLRHPPVFARAQPVWFQCKAIELAANLFFLSPDGELFCTRQQRAARERVERARAILREHLSDPPPLEELGRLVGCSPFYLSRLFSQEVGLTIQQYLRQIRMERAAELLRSGKCNVTEAALEVGYNSLSHFSATFHQTFGCCPGLYPLKTPTQLQADDDATAPPSSSPPSPSRT
jgi:AraC-like DNA-binding protein